MGLGRREGDGESGTEEEVLGLQHLRVLERDRGAAWFGGWFLLCSWITSLFCWIPGGLGYLKISPNGVLLFIL